MIKSENKRIFELDALRGIAAIIVVLFHYTIDVKNSQFKLTYGVTGVDLFFLISGFVIYLTLDNVKTAKQFIVSRVARLYPTYWIIVTFTFLSLRLFTDQDIPIAQYISNLSMFQALFGYRDIDGPYWTMFIEMLFYIFMLGLFFLNKLRYIESIGILGLIFSIIYSLILPTFSKFYYFLNFKMSLINHWPLFFGGILFYKLRQDNGQIRFYILLLVCFLTQLLLFKDGGRSKMFLSLAEYSIPLMAYFLILFLLIFNKLSFLVNSVTLFLGTVSFPLYLIHQSLSLNILFPIFLKKFQLGFMISASLSLFICIVLATLVLRIEKPVNKKIKLLLT